jgi:hypothetical protein
MQMKRHGAKCLGLALILMVALPGLLSAQDHPTRGLIDVPFDFYISGNKLPAGQYSLELIAPTYVMLRSADGKVAQDLYFLQIAVPGNNPTSKVIFAQRDGKYYFSQVWSWLGKSQLSSFNPQTGDQTRDVPLKPMPDKGAQQSAANPPGTATPPLQVLVTGCLKRSSDGGYYLTDANGTTWQLSSDSMNLGDHVMHVVSVAGKPATLAKSEPSQGGKPDAADNSARSLSVVTLKMVSNSCTR